MKRRFHIPVWRLLAVVLLTAALFLPVSLTPRIALADAAGGDFSCNNGTATGNLFDVGGGDSGSSDNVATASTYQGSGGSDAITGWNGVAGIFANVLKYFRIEVGQIMSSMYCSLQSQLQGPLTAVLTLFIVVFGIMIMAGITRFSLREGAIIMFKAALVWGFATNADWGIGFAYKFFMGVAEGGSDIVLHAICGTGSIPHFDQPDTVFTSVFNVISGGTATDPGTAAGTSCLTVSGGGTPAKLSDIPAACTSMLMVAFGLMVFLSPAITSFAGIMVVQYIALYGRALLGYLTALVLISFLFIMSPLFISFALFRVTFPLFEKWLSYLTTFCVQMIIIFGFLALLALVAGQLTNSLFQIMGTMREYNVTLQTWNIHQPMTVCSICANYSISTDSTTNATSITCPSSGTGGAAGAGGAGGAGGSDPTAITGSDGSQVIPLIALFQHQDFIIFILSQTIAWWLIAYVLQEFLKKAPELARAIGGVPYAPGLGGGGAPGDVPQINYPGSGALSALGQGARQTWENSTVLRGAVGAAFGIKGLSGLFPGGSAGAGAADAPSVPRSTIGSGPVHSMSQYSPASFTGGPELGGSISASSSSVTRISSSYSPGVSSSGSMGPGVGAGAGSGPQSFAGSGTGGFSGGPGIAAAIAGADGGEGEAKKGGKNFMAEKLIHLRNTTQSVGGSLAQAGSLPPDQLKALQAEISQINQQLGVSGISISSMAAIEARLKRIEMTIRLASQALGGGGNA